MVIFIIFIEFQAYKDYTDEDDGILVNIFDGFVQILFSYWPEYDDGYLGLRTDIELHENHDALRQAKDPVWQWKRVRMNVYPE